MTETARERGEQQSRKTHLWFGFGNYSGQPFQQIGSGFVRDPGHLSQMLAPDQDQSPLFPILYIAIGVLVLTLVIMLAAWILSLIL